MADLFNPHAGSWLFFKSIFKITAFGESYLTLNIIKKFPGNSEHRKSRKNPESWGLKSRDLKIPNPRVVPKK